MTHPVLPAKKNLGTYFGEKLAAPLQKGIEEGYQSKTLQKIFEGFTPETSHQERFEKLLSAPISNEVKKLGLQHYEKFLKEQPSFDKSDKALSAASKELPGYDTYINSLKAPDRAKLVQRVMQLGGGAEAAYQALHELTNKGQQKQGQPQSKSPQGEQPLRSLPQNDQTNLNQAENGAIPQEAEQQKHPYGWIGQILTGGKGLKKSDKKFSQEAAKTAKQLGSDLKDFGIVLKDQPSSAIASAAQGLGEIVATPIEWLEAGLKHGGILPPDADPNLIRQLMEMGRAAIAEGKTPEEQRQLQKLEGIVGLVAPLFIGGGPRGPKGNPPSLKEIPHQPKGPRRALRPPIETPDVINQGGPEGFPPQRPSGGGPGFGITPEGQARMVAGVREGEQAVARSGAAERIQRMNPFASPQGGGVQAQSPAVMPGSEARGDVSVNRAPQGPQATQSHRANTPLNNATQGALQDISAVEELRGRLQPEQPQQPIQRAPSPQQAQEVQRVQQAVQGQPIQHLGPLETEQRLGIMRGERPFLPTEEPRISGHQATETLQKQSANTETLKGELGKLRSQIQELNALERERSINNPQEQAVIDQQISVLKDQINQQKKLARQIQREIQTGREKLSDEKIREAVDRRRAKLIEDATSEKAPSDKEVAKKQLKKRALEEKVRQAKQLARKSDHLPENYFDSYLKVKEEYAKEFKRIRDAAKREMNLSEEGSQDHKVAKRMHDEADVLVREAEADIVSHRHKKGQEHKAEREKVGEQHKQREKESKKVQKLTPKKFNEFRKNLEDYHKSKSKPNAEKLAESIGVEPTELPKIEAEAKKAGEELVRKALKDRKVEQIKRKPEAKEQPRAEETTSTKSEAKEEPKAKSEDLGEKIREGNEKRHEKAKAKEETQAKEGETKAKEGIYKRLLNNSKELFKSVAKGKFKEIWNNPLGRAFIVQSVALGVDEGAKALGIKVPYGQLATIALGGVGRIHRTAATFALNMILQGAKGLHSAGKISDYNKAIEAGDIDKIRKLDESLTPKQKEKAKSKRQF